MMARSGREDLFRVGKLRLEYSVSGNSQTAAAAKHRLDRLLAKIPSKPMEALAGSLRPKGDGLWFVRRLDLELDIDLELADGEIAANWSRRLARAVTRRILDGPGADVLYFSSYEDYLARFLVDLAKGSAWEAWYYRDFDGLRALPAPMALRTALLTDPAVGLQSLSSLDSADRARVLHALTEAEAKRTLRGFAQAARQAVAESSPVDLGLLAEQVGSRPLLAREPFADALELYIRLATQDPACAGKQLATLSLAAVTLGGLVLWLSADKFQQVSSALLAEDDGELLRLLPADIAQRLMPLGPLQRSAKIRLMEAITPQPDRGGETLPGEARYTPFGGAFLLLPLLDRMPLSEVLSTWPEPPDEHKASAVRLLLLAQCMGSGRVMAAFRDPVLRDLAGVEASFSAACAKDWLSTVKPSQARDALQKLAAWRLAESSQPALQVAFLPFRRRLLAVAAEQPRGGWLLLRGCRSRRIDLLRPKLREILSSDVEISEAKAQDPKRLRSDLDFLTLPPDLEPTRNPSWTTMILAQNLLKDFACRLPGFSASSFAHLQENFLSIQATLRPEQDRWLVRLGRPPLNFVLSLTAMARQAYKLPWWDDRPIQLCQED